MKSQKLKQRVFFSIITCTLNSAEYLTKNIISVQNQSFKDYEHIFVDGGSVDKTRDLVNVYKSKARAKIKLIVNLKKGISTAFNTGIEKASGMYLVFLNSDDYFSDKLVLRDVYRYLSNNKKVDWIYGKINVVELNGRFVGIFPTKKIFQISSSLILKFFNFIPHQAVFIKRTIFSKFGFFDTSLKSNMDYDYWLRVARLTDWRYYDRLISNYVIRNGSESSDFQRMLINLDYQEIVQKRYLKWFEILLSKIINRLVIKTNKTYR